MVIPRIKPLAIPLWLSISYVLIVLSYSGYAHAQFYVMTNLEMEKVHLGLDLSGDLPMEWKKELFKIPRKIFSEAGLSPASAMDPNLIKGEANLDVTIWAIKLEENSPTAMGLLGGGGSCQGQWLYDAKIELWEHAYTSRNPTRPGQSLIWSRVSRYPRIKERLTFEEVKGDLVDMVKQFIAEYKWGNPPPPKTE